MINRAKRNIAMLLAGVMLITPTANVFAATDEVINYEINTEELETFADELDGELTKEVLKDQFNKMSEEEKQSFLNVIKYDEELLNFHKENIDPSCNIEKPKRTKRSASTLDQIRTGLQALSLPTPVYYSLVSFASSLVGAVADGPLPVGDIAALGTGVVSAIAIGYYWDDIQSKTGSIKNVFTRAFSNMSSNVSKGLDTLFAKAKGKNNKPTGNKVKDVKARLKKEGFTKEGQTGSHEQWKKGSKRVTVPNHGENSDLKIGTLRNIWKQAGWI